MLGLDYRSSSKNQLKQLDLLPIPCLYMSILSSMNSVISNPDMFQTNLSVHSLNSRQKHHLQRPTICFSSIQKRVTYSATEVSNSSPPHIITFLNNKQQFNHALTDHLIILAFYSLEELFCESHTIYKSVNYQSWVSHQLLYWTLLQLSD